MNVNYRLKDLLTQRLLEAGWTDHVRERMRGLTAMHHTSAFVNALLL